MRHVADRFSVVLDASVLYPFLVRDVLLSLAAAGLFRPLWSEAITNEWTRAFIKRRPQNEEKILATVEIMNEAFPEALVDDYQDLLPALKLPDENDRHVLAAAIRCGANAIITENLKDFPSEVVGQYDVEVLPADDFIVNTIQLYPTDAVVALRKMRLRYRSPAMTPAELMNALRQAGLTFTAAELKPFLESL